MALVYSYAMSPTGPAKNEIVAEYFEDIRLYFATVATSVTAEIAAAIAASAANKALSNLASVAVNTTLLPGTDNSIDLGSSAKRWVNFFAANLDAGASGTAGTIDVYPSTSAKGKIQFTAAANAGDTTTTIVNASQAGARTYTIPDAGASASFAMTQGAQTLVGQNSFSASILGLAGTGVSQIAYSFTGDTNSGLAWIGADNIALTLNGAAYLNLATTSISSAIAHYFADGTVGAPGIAFQGDSDCGAYRIGTNNWALAAAGAKVWETSAAGEIRQALQPCFQVRLDANSIDNVTGDGTTYTIAFDAETFDVGSHFSSTTFTAPISGVYDLSTIVSVGGVLITHRTIQVSIVTSNRTYTYDIDIPIGWSTHSQSISILADMDANDTAVVQLRAQSSTKVVDVFGFGALTYFSGSLIN